MPGEVLPGIEDGVPVALPIVPDEPAGAIALPWAIGVDMPGEVLPGIVDGVWANARPVVKSNDAVAMRTERIFLSCFA
jgi:hypothetical protein